VTVHLQALQSVIPSLKNDNLSLNPEGRIQIPDSFTAAENSMMLRCYSPNLLENLREDLAAGADEVVVVTRDKPDMDRVTRTVSQDRSLDPLLDRILFKTIDEFFS